MNWQSRLYAEYFAQGRLPDAVDIPTGLGKTSIMAIWYVALKQGAPLPKRMVYVVDRRSVVDQATTVAEQIKRKASEENLRVSTLRGQHADNREWLEDPAAPAIIVGTVDMIGSRLLFCGYGVSRRMRPYHAGLLGAGTIVVLDESQLVPPFERLLEAIDKGAELFGPKEERHRSIVPPFKLISLSATGRECNGPVFRLDEGKGDIRDEVVQTRLDAKKRLIIREVAQKNLAKEMADQAWGLSGNGEKQVRVLVYCDRREMAKKVCDLLAKRIEKQNRAIIKAGSGDQDTLPGPELFVGARRVKERADAEISLRGLGFIAGSEPQIKGPAFLIATSAGEVGVDLDADHMVCDLVSWERMIQRFGRVNRLGKGNALIVLLHGEEPKTKELEKGKPEEIRALLAWNVLRIVQELPQIGEEFDVSPGALRTLKLKSETDTDLKQMIEAATTPPPLYPALTRPLVDAWSMTSLEKHTGRPEVEPWLRGWVDEDKPQTSVLWRRYMPVRTDDRMVADREISAFFDAAPPHLSERLETETYNVMDWLTEISKRSFQGLSQDQVVAIALSSDAECKGQYTLRDFLRAVELKDRSPMFRDLPGATLVVDARIGGLKAGLLDVAADAEGLRTADDGGEWTPDVGFKIRQSGEGEAGKGATRTVYRFTTKSSPEGEVMEALFVESTVSEEGRSASLNPQLLEEHQAAVVRHVSRLATALGLPEAYVRALEFAARVHDIGKKEERWQRSFNAPQDGLYAKTKGPVFRSHLGRYRHEFGSLFYLSRDSMFQELSLDLRELVQHLVVSHHGRGRPIIEARDFEAAPPSLLRERALDAAVRFAELQKRWGPWGLAWWEALFRAADQQASKENDMRGGNDVRG